MVFLVEGKIIYGPFRSRTEAREFRETVLGIYYPKNPNMYEWENPYGRELW